MHSLPLTQCWILPTSVITPQQREHRLDWQHKETMVARRAVNGSKYACWGVPKETVRIGIY